MEGWRCGGVYAWAWVPRCVLASCCCCCCGGGTYVKGNLVELEVGRGLLAQPGTPGRLAGPVREPWAHEGGPGAAVVLGQVHGAGWGVRVCVCFPPPPPAPPVFLDLPSFARGVCVWVYGGTPPRPRDSKQPLVFPWRTLSAGCGWEGRKRKVSGCNEGGEGGGSIHGGGDLRWWGRVGKIARRAVSVTNLKVGA